MNKSFHQIVLELYLPCEALFVLTNRDPKSSPQIKKFLETLKKDTDDLLNSSENFTYKSFLKGKNRPHLFELIRYSKEELIEKNFSKRFVEALSVPLERLGFSYGTPFTKEDIVKLTVLGAKYKEDMPFNLSLTEEEIKNKKTR